MCVCVCVRVCVGGEGFMSHFILHMPNSMFLWVKFSPYFVPMNCALPEDQGNLKGKSVVAAILLSCMEVSSCTSRLFHS